MAQPVNNQRAAPSILDAALDVTIDSYVGNLPKITRDEIFRRYNAVYNGGARDPVEGLAHLRKSFRFNDFVQTYEEVGKDIEVAHQIIHLFVNETPVEQIIPISQKLSVYAQRHITEYANKTKLTPEEFKRAIFGMFAMLRSFDYSNKPAIIF